MSFVYITTNLINGKQYLGKHNGKNPNYMGSGKLLKQAILKYGKENFDIEIIADNLTEEESYKLEKQLSLEWNVVESDDWYNLKIGGFGFSSGELHPLFGVERSPEYRKKLSEANMGKHPPEEQIEKMRARMAGSGNPCYGLTGKNHPAYGHKRTEEGQRRLTEFLKNRVVSQEERKRMSLARIGKNTGQDNVMSNPVYVEKVRLSKLGRYRIYNEDGTYCMSPRIY